MDKANEVVADAFPRRSFSTPAVRLACCPPLSAWEIGKHIADVLRDGGENDRKSAATFFHSLAIKWLAEGDRYAAGEAMKAASKTWPNQRLAMLDDPQLSDLL